MIDIIDEFIKFSTYNRDIYVKKVIEGREMRIIERRLTAYQIGEALVISINTANDLLDRETESL